MNESPVKLPWFCETHPNAQVRHSWDQTHYILNGEAAGLGIRSNHKYECSICGRELAATKPNDND